MEEMIYQKEREMKVLHSGKYAGRKFAIISRGVFPVAYVELKPEELKKSISYDDYDISVHGGFTYLGKAYWNDQDKSTYIGWDYAHCDDYCGYYSEEYLPAFMHNIRYTTEEIFLEVKSVIEQFEDAEWVDVSEPHYVLKIKEEE